MENLKLNETPKRTSRNFNINNIKLENIELSEKENELNIKFNQNVDLMENIELVANENTNSKITLKYEAESNLKVLHSGIIRLHAKKNSNVKVNIINFTNLDSNIFLSIENNIEENANVEYVIVDFGGKNSLTNYYSNIEGKNANNSLNTIYLGKNNQEQSSVCTPLTIFP